MCPTARLNTRETVTTLSAQVRALRDGLYRDATGGLKKEEYRRISERLFLRTMASLALVALIVRDYDPAIRFFVDVLQFELVEDSPSLTNEGRPKRWVVVRPPGAQTGILLARADGEHQISGSYPKSVISVRQGAATARSSDRSPR